MINPVKDEADAAMALGDPAQLATMHSTASDPVVRELLDGYRARTELRIKDSNIHADRCAQMARADLPKYYMINVRCRALRAGNDLVNGDYLQWSRRLLGALDDIADFAREEIRRGLPGKYTDDVRLYYPGTVSLPEISGPGPTFSRAATGTSVPRVPVDEAPVPGPFWVEARVNGVPTRFVLDTGGSATVIGGRTARALGINQGLEGLVDYHLVIPGDRVPTRFGKIDSLQLGDFSARNVTALISDDDSVINIIGLDLIVNMGGLRISSDRLAFDSTDACAGELRLASDLEATRKAVVGMIDLDGRSVRADIDTGSGPLLLAYGSSANPVDAHVKVNGVSGSMTPSLDPHPLGARFNLGTGILRSHDMVLDLETARFCLVDKTSDES